MWEFNGEQTVHELVPSGHVQMHGN